MEDAGLSIARGEALPPLSRLRMADVLAEGAAQFPERDALVSVWQRRTLSYAGLEAEAARAAAALLARGIRAGDRVGIWSANRIEWVIVQFAVAKIGAILVHVNPAFRQAELEYTLRHSGCKAVFLIPDSGEKINVFVTIPSALAEISMLTYLMVVGVKTPKQSEQRVLAAA